MKRFLAMKKNIMRKLGGRVLLVGMMFCFGLFEAQSQIIEWDDCEKFLGNVHNGSNQSDWLDYWDQATPENAGKWGSVEGTRDQMNWNSLDIAYNLAKDNGLLFKHHVFVWGNQQPSWIESLPADEQLEEIEEWIMEYCNRYPDTDIIEVVNEPVNDPPFGNGNGNYAIALGGAGTTGSDWIIKAFELAREYCPNVALMINEYNVLSGSGLINSYMNIIDLLIERDLIDGIGAQAHEFTVFNKTAEQITAPLDQLATKGLPIYITELDIGSGDNQQPIDDAVQLAQYQEVFPALWGHSAVKGITLWGYRPGLWRETAYLVNSDGSERPAMAWLKNYVTQYNSDCANVTSVGDDLGNKYEFDIYPNPTNNSIIKVTSEQRIASVVIRDMGGKVIQYVTPSQIKNYLEIELDMNQGVYLVEIIGDDSTEIQRLLVK